eukprot:2206142-Amphidinium_carterae.1
MKPKNAMQLPRDSIQFESQDQETIATPANMTTIEGDCERVENQHLPSTLLLSNNTAGLDQPNVRCHAKQPIQKL